jgi:6-phospho-3-hexuloisomerase
MDHKHWTELIKNTVTNLTDEINSEGITPFAGKVASARRIFLIGSGRTGLITQAFGMRLAQLGLPVYIVGHPTTPALEKDDLLILFSGSGKTESLIAAARKASGIGAETFLVTQNTNSPLGELVPQHLIIPSPQQDTKVLNGTLFELSLLIIMDTVVNQIMELSGQSYDDLSIRHSNLE